MPEYTVEMAVIKFGEMDVYHFQSENGASLTITASHIEEARAFCEAVLGFLNESKAEYMKGHDTDSQFDSMMGEEE